MKQIILFVFLFFLVAAGDAQNNAPVLENVRKKFFSLENFEVTFQQLVKGKVTNSGKLYYKKENKSRIEFKNILMVTDGTTTWNLNKKEKKLIISNYKAGDISLISLPGLLKKIPAQCNITESQEGEFTVITLIPKKQNMNFNSASFRVNRDFLISNFQIQDSSGQSSVFELIDYQLNKSLSDSLFSVKEQAGIKTIDLR